MVGFPASHLSYRGFVSLFPFLLGQVGPSKSTKREFEPRGFYKLILEFEPSESTFLVESPRQLVSLSDFFKILLVRRETASNSHKETTISIICKIHSIQQHL